MDLKNLNTFICAAELGSFTRAAGELGCSQSTVSFQIKQLEEELGIQLFERINHMISLTGDGARVLGYAHRIQQLAEEMKKGGDSGNISGSIRLTAADSLCTVIAGGAFGRLHKLYPDITMHIISAGTDEMFALLGRNEVDFLYTLDSRIVSEDYVMVSCKQEYVHFVASPSHPLAGAGDISINDIVSQPFILTEHGMSYRKLLDEELARRSLEIRPFFEVGSPDVICRQVAAGDSLSFLPDFVTAQFVDRGDLVRLNVTDFDIEIWSQLIYHRGKWITPQMQAFIDVFTA